MADKETTEHGCLVRCPRRFRVPLRAIRRRRLSVLLLAAALTLPGSIAAVELPVAAQAAECNGDECEAPPPAPEDPTPGTAVVEGPSNPPVRFPGRHHKKHRHRHRHKKKRHRGR